MMEFRLFFSIPAFFFYGVLWVGFLCTLFCFCGVVAGCCYLACRRLKNRKADKIIPSEELKDNSMVVEMGTCDNETFVEDLEDSLEDSLEDDLETQADLMAHLRDEIAAPLLELEELEASEEMAHMADTQGDVKETPV